MKAISLTKGLPHIMVYTDSAIGRDVQPLFIPDIAPQWEVSVRLAVRIGRLGKCIAERFAYRYVDAVGLVAVINPVGEDQALTGREGHPRPGNPLLSIMDSAITTGRWTETTGLPSGQLTVAVVTTPPFGGQGATVGDQSLSYEIDELLIPQAISWVSRGATLKTGDMLIFSDTGFTFPLVTNTWIKASLSGVIELPEALRIKVK